MIFFSSFFYDEKFSSNLELKTLLEMQYDKVNERTSVGPMPTSHPTTNNDYRQNSDIRRTRTIVLILLSIELV